MNIFIGCYGGTRGTTIGTLVETMLRKRFGNDLDDLVRINCGGHPKFMDGKVDHPVSQENIEALVLANESAIPFSGKKSILTETASRLSQRGRKPATPEMLRSCDRIYAADTYIMGEYAKLAQEPLSEDANREPIPNQKYQTMLQGSGLRHSKFGISMDDIEAPTEFVRRVVAPKKQGKEPNPVVANGKPSFNPKDYPYYNLQGREFIAGSREAKIAAYADNYRIAERLANQIARDIQPIYDAKHPIRAGVRKIAPILGVGLAFAGLGYGLS